ncbi:uncharacterized protein [Branchiostoma lanceolatum]|uniref:uncharacterized protein n=1 Tax=Branchiostoma lanceolatum TaxID=7740 RepID=UPI003451EC38
MDKNTAVFVLLACLVASECVLGTLQLSATVPENAHVGETVTSVRSAIGEVQEEFRCEIVAGDGNGRFRLTDCVIQVARPLDYGVDSSYNLTVNVTAGSSGNPEQLYVDVQVEDVEGYPPVYNDTCEMPIQTEKGRSGDLNLDFKWTGEGFVMDMGVISLKTYVVFQRNRQQFSVSEEFYGYTENDGCLVQFAWAPLTVRDVKFLQSVWDATQLRCAHCFSSTDESSVLQFKLLHSYTRSSLECYSGPMPQKDRYFILAGSFTLSSIKRNHFTCWLPEDVDFSVSVFMSEYHKRQEVIPTFAELDFQPVGCPPKRYGLLCGQNCTCENGARCHGLNGACKCQPGWQGVVCDIPHSTVAIISTPSDSRRINITGTLTLLCKVFNLVAKRIMWTFPNITEKWLQGAQEDRVRIHNIQSEHNGTYTCNVLTEAGVVVNASYELQAIACPPGKTGESCEEECVCSHGGSCDRWAGCVCPPGWTGTTCQTSCPAGTYGQGCSSQCHCQHDATCSPTDGRCNCTDGWFGRKCSRPCPTGLYGWKCRDACTCKNNATCQHLDGTCDCVPPWTGKWCDVIKTPTDDVVETDTYTFPFSLQIAIPLILTLLVAALVLFTLFKRIKAEHAAHQEPMEEAIALLELRSMEEDLAQSLQPGWLDRWERNANDLTLDELVGMGAFAKVRKGKLRMAGADVVVAVKLVRGEDRRCYRAFCREVAALVSVHENHGEQNGGHPNIVKLLGVVTTSTRKCILLEFAAKGELVVLLKQQPRQNRPIGRFLRYAVHISRALKELRRLRIAHCDVAARNVLVSGNDVAKLADFGLAHDVYTATTYVSPANNDFDELLPLKWMALESLESREFTCESDTWSFGVLLWEIAAFGKEPSYQRQRQLSFPKLVGILRQGVRLDRPPGCPGILYDVMETCWLEEPSARPEPAELEQKLTEYCQEIDPFQSIENETLVPQQDGPGRSLHRTCEREKSVTIKRTMDECPLAVSVLGTLQLSGTVPENAHAGETVTSVRSAIGEGHRCEIVAGDKHGRFRVTNCVIQVARPLDYDVDSSFNLTVKITGSSGNPGKLFVDVQVEDVEGYPPVYNDTCEMPIRTGKGNSGDLNLNIKWTAEGMAGDVGEVSASNYIYYDGIEKLFLVIVYTDNSDCLLQVVLKPWHDSDIKSMQSIRHATQQRCLNCSRSTDGLSALQIELLESYSGFTPGSSRNCYSGPLPETDVFFLVAVSFTLSSMKKNHVTCKLPEDVFVTIRVFGLYRELIPLFVGFDIEPVGCPPNKYGVLCDQNCTCENGARCHGLNGACKCQPGWQGVVCDIPHSTVVIIAAPSESKRIYITGAVTLQCKVFHLAAERLMWNFPNKTEKWLQGAQEDRVSIPDIQSEHNGTYTCTVLMKDGTVINASYELQAVACAPGKTGESCEEECVCSNGGSCDRWAGCVCPPGWTGTTCQTSCPAGTYGQGCSSRCRCQNGAPCSPIDGRCNCTEGWFGSNCDRPCSLAGLYGWRCRHACACKNNAACHHVDGTCACIRPWTGKWCDVVETDTFPLSLKIVIPLVLTLLVTALVLFILFKRNKAKHAGQEKGIEEAIALLELRSMEEDLAQSLQPGWLSRWERNADDLTLDELVGLGAFAKIRRAQLRMAGDDVTVAVKSVRGEDRRFYRAFCREVAALAIVHENREEQNGGHPNIVKLLGVVTTTTPKCIILEFAAKGELLIILKQQPRQNRPLGRFLRYAVHISRALKELRRLRIAHGDVAARNVLVSGDDVAKLADFGLAHDVYTTITYVSPVNNDFDELLPLKWMALESLESREFTCESDTWSFGVLLWEIAAFGEEPCYQRQRQLSCPKLVGILRQGVRLDRPPGCLGKLYDVMKSCWLEEPSARPDPAELEQKLTECCHEMEPLLVIEKEALLCIDGDWKNWLSPDESKAFDSWFAVAISVKTRLKTFNMDKNKAFYVLLACLVASECVLGTLQLSANVLENAHEGETVAGVRSAIGEVGEEVSCEIVAGDRNGRFRVTDCVIQVARPLDYGVDPSYNLTVNVTGSSGNPEQLYVDIQVKDVEGYPLVYNDTCEMPIRTAKGKSAGDLLLDIKWTAEGMAVDIGEVSASNYFYYDGIEKQFLVIVYTDNSDCLLQVVWKPWHDSDIKSMQSIRHATQRRCFNCSRSTDGLSVLQIELLKSYTGFTPGSSRNCYSGPLPETDLFFLVAGSFTISSMKKNHVTCKLPEDVFFTIHVSGLYREVIPLFVGFDIEPVGCPPNRYGFLCDQNCTCENGARCHGLNGACKCQPGWQGVVCDIPHSTVAIIATPSDSRRIYITGSVTLQCKVFHLAAERLMWTFPNKTEKRLQGAQEDRVRIHNIQSEHNGTYTCTVFTEDRTVINANYELQAVTCPPGKTGESCEEDCVCSHGGSCDRWAGCVCPPGWTGTTCQTSCPPGIYGQGCSSQCRCQHDATCSPTDGRCNCTEGWFGSNCDRPCNLAGRYGWRCREACLCKNNATCHHVDGTCACFRPWTGKWCDVVETDTFPLSLKIIIPLVLTLLVTALVLFILFKRNKAKHAGQEEGIEEATALLELRSMEEDLTQSLQPGWLSRWERNADDLTLDELVGLGSFAKIRRGKLRTAGDDVTVAVKSVRGEDRRCYRAFCREVAALAIVHENREEQNGGHPNIVKLLGVVTTTTPKFIFLEFAAKGELLIILKQQPRQNRPLGRFLRYAVHISRALKELRRLRIAHGDVAARNVLVSGDDVAKLADFGLAHDVYTTATYVSSVNDDFEELLPLKWMALESLESREFTCESDTWSFGVLLWEIAAFGEEPSYQRQRQLSCPKLVGILRQGVRLDRPPGCLGNLYDVMKSCWLEEPSARPEPAELEQKLTEYCQKIDPLLVIENETLL